MKWATCNVGAISPEEYGDYFAWGEVEPKQDFSRYKYSCYIPEHKEIDADGFEITIRETCADIGKDISGTEYDAAHVKWGGSWRMPTDKEHAELRNICSIYWTKLNNVYGFKIVGPNGNWLFLPAGGYYYNDEYVDYWKSYDCALLQSNKDFSKCRCRILSENVQE